MEIMDNREQTNLTRRKWTSKRHGGSSIAEFPVVLIGFLLCLLMPMIDLAFIAFRTSFVHTAAHNAAQSAGRAKTFSANGANGELSAINIAKRDAIAVKNNGAGGVNFADTDVIVNIVGTPLKTGKPEIRQNTPLTAIDTKDYLFQIEVTVNGQVQPLVTLSDSFFGQVPGLTAPMPIQASYKQFCEHPGGLSK